jgi:hypothetical protein
VLLGHAHVDTLLLNSMAPVEERVGDVRSDDTNGDTTTGIVDTGSVTRQYSGGGSESNLGRRGQKTSCCIEGTYSCEQREEDTSDSK